MLNKIIAYSIKNKLIIGLFITALIGWGVFETTRLPIDAVPDITDNQVQVITVSPSLGANDIERLVTFPIEQACSSIPGTKQIRSFSRFGLSLITIVFKDGFFLEPDEEQKRLRDSHQSAQINKSKSSALAHNEAELDFAVPPEVLNKISNSSYGDIK